MFWFNRKNMELSHIYLAVLITKRIGGNFLLKLIVLSGYTHLLES